MPCTVTKAAPRRVAAIHQPNFFPWLGYFGKIARADVFVVLDDVQHQKTGSNWSNRMRILAGGTPQWVTAPVRRPAHGTMLLSEAQWDTSPWRGKFLKGLQLGYARAPHYRECLALVEPLIRNTDESLATFNTTAVRAIASALGLRDNVVLASRYSLQSTATERLADLVYAVGCDTYLAGGGATGYQEDALFEARGLAVEYLSFVHPEYPQLGSASFVPGLSIIDALMNCGIAGTRDLLIP